MWPFKIVRRVELPIPPDEVYQRLRAWQAASDGRWRGEVHPSRAELRPGPRPRAPARPATFFVTVQYSAAPDAGTTYSRSTRLSATAYQPLGQIVQLALWGGGVFAILCSPLWQRSAAAPPTPAGVVAIAAPMLGLLLLSQWLLARKARRGIAEILTVCARAASPQSAAEPLLSELGRMLQRYAHQTRQDAQRKPE